VRLKEAIYRIFQCKDKRTAQRRYAKVIALRDGYVAAMPGAAKIFGSLERHLPGRSFRTGGWPKLVNAMGGKIIPNLVLSPAEGTNNAVELVIRRFDQHH